MAIIQPLLMQNDLSGQQLHNNPAQYLPPLKLRWLEQYPCS
ncbi:hypothetical protein AM1_A0297 (plasmid) [Acaryochloris marina MBIC11017]|uniref:Uncharacterized protein n=1 Tax=Acaryochloris marina (strain MBIC 11017) TaxID=329726 RepID=A8ZKU7_ACAM1|nr:hypothetical protein AM1_A0297 [Acaryochloris marina MBIC11017]